MVYYNPHIENILNEVRNIEYVYKLEGLTKEEFSEYVKSKNDWIREILKLGKKDQKK